MIRTVALVSLSTLAFAEHTTTIRQVGSPGEEVLLEFTVYAQGDTQYDTELTPFEGLFDSILTVLDNSSGDIVPYQGKVARRVADLDTTVFTEDGGHITALVDIAESYDLEPHGSYTVEFDSAYVVVDAGDNPGKSSTKRHDLNETAVDAWMSCTSSENSQISSAENQAATQVSRSRSSLSSGAGSLYNEWFGAHSSSRFNKVQSGFNAINSNLRRSRYACDRTCPGVYAYVYPSDTSQTIYLCDVFWSRPSERAETIVHEVSHFNRIMGTDDWAYGQSACRNLARSNPDRAVDNADNVCYFGKFA